MISNQEELFNGSQYGLLNNSEDIKIHRHYFNELVSLLGVQCIFKAPRVESKHYSERGELKSVYEKGMVTGCIFQDHPDAKTLKKLG